MKKSEAMQKIGPTGKFPKGKLRPDDKGGLNTAIGIEDGKIIMHFGAWVSWIAMTAAEARLFAALLLEKAKKLDDNKN